MSRDFVKVSVHRNPMERHVSVVHDYEVPILNAMFGDENVQLEPFDEGEAYDTGDIDPAGEYERLGARYGANESGVPWVQFVYGRFEDGHFEDQCTGSGDTSDKLTRKQIMTELDGLGVEYNPRDKLAALNEILKSIDTGE